MPGINDQIATAIGNLSTTTLYLRAIHMQEANYSLPKIDLSNPIGINANIDAVEALTSDSTTYTTLNYPIDVWFMTKNTSQDDLGTDIDTILDAMELLAHEFYQLMQPLEGSGLALTDTYTLTPIINWSDEILSGYQITFDLPSKVTAYVCQP